MYNCNRRYNNRKHSHSPLLPVTNGSSPLQNNSEFISSSNLKSFGPIQSQVQGQTRIRKSFSMNDVKQFLLHEAKNESTGRQEYLIGPEVVLDSRAPVPVLLSGSNYKNQLLK